MIGKPVLRVGKLKKSGDSSLAATDGHLSRSVPTKNADPTRAHLNEWLVGGPGDLTANVKAIMDKAGIDPDRLRKDATVANDVVLTVSPEWFRPNDPDAAGTWEEEKLEAFRREGLALLRKQFGPRLAAAVLHLDESTPHIQAVVVPVLKRPDGTNRLTGRDYFNAVRMVSLQDDWEARLTPLGVGPREKGSTATHTTIKSYYSALQKAPEVPEALPPAPTPARALLPGGGEAMAAWQKDEVAKVTRRQKPLAAAAAKGILYEAERRAGDTMRRQVGEQAARARGFRDQLASVTRELALSRDEIAVLRGVPVNEVAAALGYAGEIGRRENAIDLVKRVGELSFEESARWLALAFGPAAAGAAVREATAQPIAPDQVPLTAADKVKAVAARKQLDALAAPTYRVTVMHQRDDGERYAKNVGKTKDGAPEKLWTRDEVLALIPNLTAQNARGGNIFITPIDPSTHHALIDDLSADNVRTMKERGYTFSTLVETSPGNMQGVVKVTREGVSDAAVNEWFKATNRDLGDDHITGLTHPMRLAGFQNRKAKYEDEGRFPFVRVVEAVRTVCARARAVITEMTTAMIEADLGRPRRP